MMIDETVHQPWWKADHELFSEKEGEGKLHECQINAQGAKMSRQLDAVNVLWTVLLALSGAIILAPVCPELMEREILTGKEWSE